MFLTVRLLSKTSKCDDINDIICLHDLSQCVCADFDVKNGELKIFRCSALCCNVYCSVSQCHDQCGEFSYCTGSPGPAAAYSCTCVEGYSSPSRDGKNCVLSNLCLTLNGGCGNNSICNSTSSSSNTCMCKQGFSSQTNDGKNCVLQGRETILTRNSFTI